MARSTDKTIFFGRAAHHQ